MRYSIVISVQIQRDYCKRTFFFPLICGGTAIARTLSSVCNLPQKKEAKKKVAQQALRIFLPRLLPRVLHIFFFTHVIPHPRSGYNRGGRSFPFHPWQRRGRKSSVVAACSNGIYSQSNVKNTCHAFASGHTRIRPRVVELGCTNVEKKKKNRRVHPRGG